MQSFYARCSWTVLNLYPSPGCKQAESKRQCFCACFLNTGMVVRCCQGTWAWEITCFKGMKVFSQGASFAWYASQAEKQLKPQTQRESSWREAIGWAKTWSQPRESMDWFKGKFTGKPHIYWENRWFPVDFPLNQSIEGIQDLIRYGPMNLQVWKDIISWSLLGHPPS